MAAIPSGGSPLAKASRRALIVCTLYSLILLALMTWPGAITVELSFSPWSILGPVVLLLTAFAATSAYLLRLIVLLRRMARSLLAGTEWRQVRQEDGAGSFGRRATREATVAVAITASATLALPLSAHGHLTPITAWALGLAPLLGLLDTGRSKISALESEDHEVRSNPKRLRGASVLVAVTGLLGTGVVLSFCAAMLLPLALAQHLPRRPTLASQGVILPTVERNDGAAAAGISEVDRAALQGGAALHSLAFAGSPRGPAQLENPPTSRYGAWWSQETPVPIRVPPELWADSLFLFVAEDRLTAPERAFLRHLNAHPAQAEFPIIAATSTLAIADTRWRAVGDSAITVFEFPVPRYVELWSGIRGRIAGAALTAEAGDRDKAITMVRDVERLGLLLFQNGPIIPDTRIGISVVMEARRAHASLVKAFPGPNPVPGAAQGSRSAMPPSGLKPGTSHSLTTRLSWIAGHIRTSVDETSPKGPRWEGVAVAGTFAPCGSPSRIVWGLASPKDPWLSTVKQSLPASPREREMLSIYKEGYLGTRTGLQGWGWLPTTLSLVFGERPVATHCAPLLAAMHNL